MASILTNQSAIVALQTLRDTNRNLTQVQDQISTGRAVANARDNAAIFAISTVIESDIESFRAINESLSLGSSTVAVGRTAAEQVTSLLQETQSLIVSAQEENVDRSQIQTGVAANRDQIVSIINAAQFNGLNLVRGEENVSVLSSLDRAADGSVTASQITVNRQNLELNTGTFDSTATAAVTLGTPSLATITGTPDADTVPNASTFEIGSSTTATAGQTFSFDLGGTTITTAAFTGGEDADAIATALETAANAAGVNGFTFSTVTAATSDSGNAELVITAQNGTADTTVGNLTSTAADTVGNTSTLDLSGLTITANDTVSVDIGGQTVTTAALTGGETAQQVFDALNTAFGNLSTPPAGVTLSFDSGTGVATVTADNTVTAASPVAVGNLTQNPQDTVGNQSIIDIDLSSITVGSGDVFSFTIGTETINTAALSGGEDADALAAAIQTAIGLASLPTGITATATAAGGGNPARITIDAANGTADTTVSSLTRTTGGAATAGTATAANIDGLTPAATATVNASASSIDGESPAAQAVDTASEANIDGLTPVAQNATSTLTFQAGAVAANEGFRIALGVGSTTRNFDFVAREGDTINDVAASLEAQIRNAGIDGVSVSLNRAEDPTANNAVLSVTAANGTTATVAASNTSGGNNVAGGGLSALGSIDVSTAEGAESALTAIEGLLQTSIDAAAAFGSVENRIEIQSEFVSRLTDSLRVGVGSLVDADLEEASARLQSLQVQQQLGTQALSIANQAPQSILALFR